MSALFGEGDNSVYGVTADGALFHWSCEVCLLYALSGLREVIPLLQNPGSGLASAGAWTLTSRHFFKQGSSVECASLHVASGLLSVGFKSGLVALYQVINTVAFAVFLTSA